MSPNLISLAFDALDSGLPSRIASTLGVDSSVVEKACSGAIPALLSSLANVASTKEGAVKLANAASEQTPGLLGALSSSISDTGRQGLIETGLRGLTSLVGQNSISLLSRTVARFAGLGESSSSSLLGILGPFLLGMLGKQMSEHNLDASSLARLLGSQKDSFQSAMPSGFKDLLQSAAPSMKGLPRQAEYRGAASGAFASAGRRLQSSQGSSLMWLVPLIALGVIGAWFLTYRKSNETDRLQTSATQPIDRNVNALDVRTETTAAIPPAEKLSVGGVDLSSTMSDALAGVQSTLQGITDPSSAKAALPKLETAMSEFDKVLQLSRQLPGEGKTRLAALVSAARPTLESSFDKVLAIPGVDAVAKPTIEAVRGKLAMLSTA